MTERVPPVVAFGVIGALCVAAGAPLYQVATDPLYHGGVPKSPVESGQPFPYLRSMPAMAATSMPTAPFVDASGAAGLDYEWTISGPRPLNILQTIGNGCALFDFDNDGNLDVLLVGPRLALYRGDGHGRFTNVSRETGLADLHGHFLGCAAGDYDGDGHDDLYISGYRTGVLLHNEPALNGQPVDAGRRHSQSRPSAIVQRRFRDVTRAAGIEPQPWGTSCAFLETAPGAGRLDLYVCNYVDFDPQRGPALCRSEVTLTACPPTTYRPLRGVLYLNEGRGRFRDATESVGAAGVAGNGLGVAAADFDGTPRTSIALANDQMPGDLLCPAADQRALRYWNCGMASGTAYDPTGNLHSGMGLDWGDYDNDGKLDLFVTAFAGQAKSLYHNDGRGFFSDQGIGTGIAAACMPYVAFGCKFLDFDNDGWLDLMIANGHVNDNTAEINRNTAYRQPTKLFHNRGERGPGFEDVSHSSPDLARPIVGRGLAAGDYDNDGRVDALVVDAEGKPLLLHNQNQPSGHWLGVRLIGSTSNRDGYGALLTLRTDRRVLLRQCTASGSYLSASDRRVNFGLGPETHADSLTVRWPSGRMSTLRNLPIDRYITVRESLS